MTAVDRAELKRLAEGATPGPWDIYGERIKGNRALAAAEALAQVNQTDEVSDAFWLLNAGGKCPALTGCGPNSEANAAFIAAANPAVVLELLSEIEGLRKTLEIATDNACEYFNRVTEAERQIADLRTQAPDSWRPIAEHDNSADEVLVMAEGFRKPIVAWRHHPSSRTDEWFSVPGKYRVKPTEFHPLPALRPQTAESGK